MRQASRPSSKAPEQADDSPEQLREVLTRQTHGQISTGLGARMRQWVNAEANGSGSPGLAGKAAIAVDWERRNASNHERLRRIPQTPTFPGDRGHLLRLGKMLLQAKFEEPTQSAERTATAMEDRRSDTVDDTARRVAATWILRGIIMRVHASDKAASRTPRRPELPSGMAAAQHDEAGTRTKNSSTAQHDEGDKPMTTRAVTGQKPTRKRERTSAGRAGRMEARGAGAR